jgi:hypothetical protein
MSASIEKHIAPTIGWRGGAEVGDCLFTPEPGASFRLGN